MLIWPCIRPWYLPSRTWPIFKYCVHFMHVRVAQKCVIDFPCFNIVIVRIYSYSHFEGWDFLDILFAFFFRSVIGQSRTLVLQFDAEMKMYAKNKYSRNGKKVASFFRVTINHIHLRLSKETRPHSILVNLFFAVYLYFLYVSIYTSRDAGICNIIGPIYKYIFEWVRWQNQGSLRLYLSKAAPPFRQVYQIDKKEYSLYFRL